MTYKHIRRMAAVAGLALCGAASAQTVPAPAAPAPAFDGTQQVQAFTLPLSDFLSEDYKRAEVRNQLELEHAPLWPTMETSKADWAAFDAASDKLLYTPSVNWSLAHYPVDIVETHIAGVHAGIITPKGGVAAANKGRVLINLHNGGFIGGRGLQAGKAESIPVASLGGIKVITLDYRQVPDAAFPAASEDVEAVYRELLKTHKPGQIGIYGCSAGGMLTGQAVAWFQKKGLPRPGAIGIFCSSPMPMDMSGDSSIFALIDRPGTPPGTLVVPPRQKGVSPMTGHPYFAGTDFNDPLVIPGRSDAVLAKFPPTLLLGGTRAGEASAQIATHAKLLKLGVDSSLYLMEGGRHGAFMFNYDAPESRDAMAYVAKWFQAHLER